MSCNGDCNQGRECNCKCKMTKDTALRMAIEFIEDNVQADQYDWLIQACKEALAKTQEPAAQVEVRNGAIIPLSIQQYAGCDIPNGTVKLYTTPPSREWVGLSDEEMSEIFARIGWVEKDNNLKDLGFYDHARAIEAKLKDKNELFGNSR